MPTGTSAILGAKTSRSGACVARVPSFISTDFFMTAQRSAADRGAMDWILAFHRGGARSETMRTISRSAQKNGNSHPGFAMRAGSWAGLYADCPRTARSRGQQEKPGI